MNKCLFYGRVASDIDVSYLNNEQKTAKARFSLAVSRNYKNAEGKYDADFINCVAFGGKAENIGKFFQKGSKIIICSHVQTGSYEKEGRKVYTTDFNVDDFFFVDSANKAQSVQNPGQTNDGFMNIPDNVGAEGLPFN